MDPTVQKMKLQIQFLFLCNNQLGQTAEMFSVSHASELNNKIHFIAMELEQGFHVAD